MNRRLAFALPAFALLVGAPSCDFGLDLGKSDAGEAQDSGTPGSSDAGNVPVDSGTAALDAGGDAGVPPVMDAGSDAGLPPVMDAGVDAGADAGADAGVPPVDAGSDAGLPVDAGVDAGVPPPPGDGGIAVDPRVYLSDSDTLYRYELATNTVTKVGDYDCLSTATGSHDMAALALDSAGNLYGTTYKLFPPGQGYGALVRINPSTAKCNFIVFDPVNGGIFPADMEFFPAGMVRPGVETLVGMDNGQYVEINTSNGDVLTLGNFAGGGQQTTYLPEAGIAAAGGKAYTRVYASGGGRFVAEFKPAAGGPSSGNMVRLLNLSLPDHAATFVRIGTNLYAFGKMTGSTSTVFKIDLAAETMTPLPVTTGMPTAGVFSAAAAPRAP